MQMQNDAFKAIQITSPTCAYWRGKIIWILCCSFWPTLPISESNMKNIKNFCTLIFNHHECNQLDLQEDAMSMMPEHVSTGSARCTSCFWKHHFPRDSCTYSNPESPLFLSAGKHRASTRVLCPIQVARWLTMGSVGPVDKTLSCECCGQKYLG